MTFRLAAMNQINGVMVCRTVNTTVTVGSASNTVWKRDVVYLGSEAVAEIDADGVHELHNDHLGSPLVITRGATAQIEGRLAAQASIESNWFQYGPVIDANNYWGAKKCQNKLIHFDSLDAACYAWERALRKNYPNTLGTNSISEYANALFKTGGVLYNCDQGPGEKDKYLRILPIRLELLQKSKKEFGM